MFSCWISSLQKMTDMKFEPDIPWIVDIQQTEITGPVYVTLHFIHLLLYFSISKRKWVKKNLKNYLTLQLSRYETEYLQNYSLWNIYKIQSCCSSHCCMLAMQDIQLSKRTEVKSTTNTQPSLLSFSTWGRRLDTWRNESL